jgi:hypothetical protein
MPASEQTREQLKALMEGKAEVADSNSNLVRMAARQIIEEALEGEAEDALGLATMRAVGRRERVTATATGRAG